MSQNMKPGNSERCISSVIVIIGETLAILNGDLDSLHESVEPFLCGPRQDVLRGRPVADIEEISDVNESKVFVELDAIRHDIERLSAYVKNIKSRVNF